VGRGDARRDARDAALVTVVLAKARVVRVSPQTGRVLKVIAEFRDVDPRQLAAWCDGFGRTPEETGGLWIRSEFWDPVERRWDRLLV